MWNVIQSRFSSSSQTCSMNIYHRVPPPKHEIVIVLNILGEGLGSDCHTSQMSKVKLSINHFTNGFAF